MKTDIVRYLLDSGADVNLTQEASDKEAHPRDGLFVLPLTNDAAKELRENSIIATLYRQWSDYKAGLTDVFETSMSAQIAAYEVEEMQAIGNGWVKYVTNDTDLPSHTGGRDVQFISGADAVALELPGATDDGKFYPLVYISAESIERGLRERGFGTGTGGSTYGPGNGNPPGTGTGTDTGQGNGGTDTGQGGSEWDTSGANWKKICFNPPILLDGPHPEDAITNLNPSTQIIPTEHDRNVTQKVKDVFHNGFGFFGKLFRFKAADFSFDGLTVNSVHYLFPVDVTLPVLFPLAPRILYNEASGATITRTIDPTGGPIDGTVKVKVDGVETDFEVLICNEYSEAIGVAGNHTADPNSGTYIRCNDITLIYSQATPPFYAAFDPADVATDHDGLRWFLECLYCQNPTAYEVTLPFTAEAETASYDRLTAGYSAAYLHNGMNNDAGIENSTGVHAWYPPTGGCSHGQVFLPEESTATKIVFDVDITNPTGVSDADWNIFLFDDSDYSGTGGTFLGSAGTQHNTTSGLAGRHTVHLELDIPSGHDFCTPFAFSVVGGVLVYKIVADYA